MAESEALVKIVGSRDDGAIVLGDLTYRLASIFKDDDGAGPLIEHVRNLVADFEPDVTTKKGRDEIASLAYKVARSKTALDTAGKELAAEAKAVVKRIDVSRKKIRDELDEIKNGVRLPLTKWEEAEKRRIDEIEAKLGELQHLIDNNEYEASTPLSDKLKEVKAIEISKELFAEFVPKAAILKDKAVQVLEQRIVEAEKREAEAAELEQLRLEKAQREAREKAEREERERKEREERIAREAEERARKEAEREAVAREAAIREEAERKLKAETEAAEQKEREARLRLEAWRRERAEREAAAKKEAEAERKRIMNEQHRVEIHGEIIKSLEAVVDRTTADRIVRMIAEQQIPHVTINY